MRVEVVKSIRSNKERTWDGIVAHLVRNGVKVNHRLPEADVFVVLSGAFENPLCMNGKRILFYKKQEWTPKVNNAGWDHWYSKLLCHYYDEMVDCSADTPDDTLERIRCLKTAN